MDLNIFLDSIKGCKYALIKVDVPYMPKEFPDVIPEGKDLDIICTKSDFGFICDRARVLFKDYKIVEEGNNFRLRMMRGKRLYYQIDVTYDYMDKSFTEAALKRRKREKNYYVLSVEDEVRVRMEDFKMHPYKQYHMDYVNRHLHRV